MAERVTVTVVELVYESPLLIVIEVFEGAVVSDVDGVGVGVSVGVGVGALCTTTNLGSCEVPDCSAA